MNDFLEFIKMDVESVLGSDYQVSIHCVVKNNGICFHELAIRYRKEMVCPSICMDVYYEEYLRGERMENITTKVLLQYQKALHCRVSEKIDLSYQHIKNKIVYRLVNREKNETLQKECITTEFMDFLITYHILLSDFSEQDQASVRIMKNMITMWNIDAEEVHKQAERNTKRLLPPMLCSIQEIISRCFLEAETTKDTEELATLLPFGNIPLYILTNEQKLYGAAAILYQDLLQKFTTEISSDIYLLPSSVHEFLLLPVSAGVTKEKLEAVVQSVNRTKLSNEDFLSDAVYYYSKRTEKFQKL